MSCETARGRGSTLGVRPANAIPHSAAGVGPHPAKYRNSQETGGHMGPPLRFYEVTLNFGRTNHRPAFAVGAGPRPARRFIDRFPKYGGRGKPLPYDRSGTITDNWGGTPGRRALQKEKTGAAGANLPPLLKKCLPATAAPSLPKAPAGSSAPRWRRCTGRSPPGPGTAPVLGRSSKSHRYRCAA